VQSSSNGRALFTSGKIHYKDFSFTQFLQDSGMKCPTQLEYKIQKTGLYSVQKDFWLLLQVNNNNVHDFAD
jgi:hypothetical protein